MTRRLYRTPIPESAFRDTGETATTQLAKLAGLTGGSSVQSTGSEPSDLTLNVQYRGTYAGRLALELTELLHSDTATILPYAPTSGSAEDDGYYVAESVSPGRIRPQTDRVVDVDASLSRKGTRATHFQAVETAKNSRDNDFGSDTTTYVGVPASASLIRWWDGDATTEYPSPVATRSAEHGDVEIYDQDAASVGVDDPTLLYRPTSYDAIGDVDVGVWDTYSAGASREDSNGIIQWQRVFSTEHDRRGEYIVENGLLRLTLTDSSISAEAWDDANSTWSSVSLGTSSWSPVDVDIRTISPSRVEARILFSDGSSRYPLDMELARGDTDALWVRTPNAQSQTPSGLQTLLDPIAQTTIYTAQESQGLTAREEVAQ